MFSGLFRMKYRISSVAREKREGTTSCARIDADRSSMMTRSSRSYCATRLVNGACGRTSENTSAPPPNAVNSITAASRSHDERRDSDRNRGCTGVLARWTRRYNTRTRHAAARTGSICHHETYSGLRKRTRSADLPRVLLAGGRRTQQLHELLGRRVRLVPQLRRQPRRELEVVFRIPVVRRRFDRFAEFVFGAAQPGQTRVGLVFHDRLLKERGAGPEMRLCLERRLLREIDHLVISLQAVQRDEVIGERAIVFGGRRLPDDGDGVEPGFRGGIAGGSLFEATVRERGIGISDDARPPRVADQRDADEKQQHDENRAECTHVVILSDVPSLVPYLDPTLVGAGGVLPRLS